MLVRNDRGHSGIWTSALSGWRLDPNSPCFVPTMPPSRPDDQALLDRLNALKSTPVVLEQPAK